MKTILYIEGMMCPHCSARVQKALEALDGVSEALVNHEVGMATVTHENVPEDTLKETVRAAGYTVKD
jgi:Cu2+-exporting ATPase